MSFRPSDNTSGGGRCCDMMTGRRPLHGYQLLPEHNRHWRTWPSSSILFLVFGLLILAIANAHQQLPTAGTYKYILQLLMAVMSVVRLCGITQRRASVNTESFQVKPTATKLLFLMQRRRRRSSGKLINAKSLSCSSVCS